MAKVLLIHHDPSACTYLELLLRPHHDLESAGDLAAGLKRLAKSDPDVILVSQDSQKDEAVRLLRHFKTNGLDIPVVVLVSRGGGLHLPAVMKLGARGFLEYPVDESRLNSALNAAMQAKQTLVAGPPPITDEELSSNLSLLENHLNKRMRCVAGKNQVFLQSVVIGRGGMKTKPRICLKCSLRGQYGLDRDVYYEYIRDVCCADPGKCKAVRLFRATRETA